MRIPVSRLVVEMTYEEMLGWQHYFSIKPPGYDEDVRAYKTMCGFGNKLPKAEQIFESIAVAKLKAEERPMGQKLAGTKMLAMIMNSKGGDVIPM